MTDAPDVTGSGASLTGAPRRRSVTHRTVLGLESRGARADNEAMNYSAPFTPTVGLSFTAGPAHTPRENRYEITRWDGFKRMNVQVAVRMNDDSWMVTNRHASFTVEEIREAVATGRWTVEA